MSSKRAIFLLFVTLIVQKSAANEDGFDFQLDNKQTIRPKTTNNLQLMPGLMDQPESTRSFLESSTFNPEVLNKFLEEYASKIKYTTEDNFKLHPYDDNTGTTAANLNDHNNNFNAESNSNLSPTENYNTHLPELMEAQINDTNERHKYPQVNNNQDDRNGWVALDAVPWSKSKISKWQSSPSTQNPWPDMDNWDTPNTIKPWYNRPKPAVEGGPSRPTYGPDNSNYAQKWPPEISPWDKNPHRPNMDIITDNRPSNFPNSWDRNQLVKPNYPWNRYPNYNPNNNFFDWNQSLKYDHLENMASNHPDYNKRRPSFSQYQYEQNHSPAHHSGGDGQWILLSTNRGYSKTRQRSIKINTANSQNTNVSNSTSNDAPNPTVTSRRQVRLTVLPSINGVNTTVSHGGLLEVENTFKTVDQSQKEYEQSKLTKLPTIIRNKPMKNPMISRPSKAAVLAAVGAGMLPVTMAMMIPMMLGRRRKRSTKNISNLKHTLKYIHRAF